MRYVHRMPTVLMRLWPGLRWQMPVREEAPAVYLTFDDGPCPGVTEPILDLLAREGAHASFFCVGARVATHPQLFRRIREEGHAVGNHTHRHLDGWQTPLADYLADVREAQAQVESHYFRPPYGRTTPRLCRRLAEPPFSLQTVMWSLLSGDFDPRLDPLQCAAAVVRQIRPGDIVVFHDSQKAAPRVLYALPQILAHLRAQGWLALALP